MVDANPKKWFIQRVASSYTFHSQFYFHEIDYRNQDFLFVRLNLAYKVSLYLNFKKIRAYNLERNA